MTEQELKEILEEKIREVESKILECNNLKAEWEERIEEAKTAKRHYDSLIDMFSIELAKIKINGEI